MLYKKKKLKLAKELSDMVVYCKSVHFNGFEDAKKNLGFYEMSSFKEGKAMNLAEESGEGNAVVRCFSVMICFKKITVRIFYRFLIDAL